jgi:hypothetical protein
MLLLDDSSPQALAVDARIPMSAAGVAQAVTRAWPRLAGRITIAQQPLSEVTLSAQDVVVATHACGALTDRVLDMVLAARARVAALPCCHDEETCDAGGLRGWLDLDTAVDATRVARLRAHDYTVHTQRIPRAITAQNRLLIAQPRSPQA